MASGFGGVFSIAVATNTFRAFIELLEAQGTVQVLSSPRVATVNNQKAVIKVGQDEFFVTDISTTTVTGTATTSTPNVTLTPFFSGIALDVTPQIDAGGSVTLHIHPSVSEVVDQTKTFTIAGESQSLPLAQSRIRESDSIVRAQNGQIVVIGGLMQETASDRYAGPPGIGRTPVLGSMLSHRQELATKSELVILLRPLVVDSPEAWGAAAAQTEGFLDALMRDRNRGYRAAGDSKALGSTGTGGAY
jgi:MSHA biogenesis protein MshL